MKYLATLALAAACMMIIGCGDDPASSNAPTLSNGSMGAKVNGSGWGATSIQTSWQSNVLSLGGSEIAGSGNRQINITAMVSSTGTYQFNPFAGINASYTEGSFSGGVNVKIYQVTSGTLKVDKLTSSGASGTFSFEGKESQNGTETRSVTEGTFDVKF